MNSYLTSGTLGVVQSGIYTGRGSAQPFGDVNGNGPWAPQWYVRDAANVGLATVNLRGYRYDGVAGFDNLVRQWTRVGMVYDTVSGLITQIKTQELIPGGNIYTMNNPLGPAGQSLYVAGGAGTPVAATSIMIYNVGNGTISAYDNIYVGEPYTWTAVIPEPSSLMLLGTGLLGFAWRRRRA